MPRGSRIVDIAGQVQPVEQFYVAYEGTINLLGSGFVSALGIVRQFWPSTVTDGSAIVLTPEAETSYATAESAAKAICDLDVRTGRVVLSDGDTIRYIQAINPTPRSAGQYLWKFDILSGDIVADDPEGVWVDVFSEGNLGIKQYSLTNNFPVPSNITGQGLISIAEDNGAGAPVPGTEATKTINFIAEITGDNLNFTTAPWQLIDIQYNEPASTIVLTVPDGWVGEFGTTQDAFITGNEAYKEVIREIYAISWGPQFTVQVDVVSGAVTGDATGVALTTSVRRVWEVLADTPGDNLFTEIDVTISDGISFVTKRVTMNSQYITEGTPPDTPTDISDDFTQYDRLQDTWRQQQDPPPQAAGVTVVISPTGLVNVSRVADGDVPGFPQAWNVNAPTVLDPQNYECRMTVVGDPVYVGSSLTSEWLNCSSERLWTYFEADENLPPQVFAISQGDWILEVREVGFPNTVKQKVMDVEAVVVGPEDGGVIP
jgi:hypothetical protein